MKLKDLFYIVLFSILFSFEAIRYGMPQSLIRVPFSLEEKPLQVTVRSLSPSDSKAILKYDITQDGYQPIEVTITNQGSNLYTVSRASTSLPCATASEVAWKQTRRAIPRGIGMKLLSLIAWPFSIVSGIDGITTFKKHRSRLRTLEAKGFKDTEETIPPYSVVKRVLYIPASQVETSFSVALEDKTEDVLVVIPVQLLSK